MKTAFILASFMVAAFAVSPAVAETRMYKVDLTGSAQAPAVDTKGGGSADVAYDTNSKQLSWKVTYKDLSGDVTAAHFHGPAKTGENAPPIVDISRKVKEGTATITDTQAADLDAGMWYLNLHTAKHPDGEIRGQVLRVN